MLLLPYNKTEPIFLLNLDRVSLQNTVKNLGKNSKNYY